MAYKQRNPFSRKSSSPLNNTGNVTRAVANLIKSSPRIDPTFNPDQPSYYEVIDQQGRSGDDMEGGYVGMTTPQNPPGSKPYSPSGVSTHLYRSGDLYAQDRNMQSKMSFDPKSGYTPRMLPITYNKDEEGKPTMATITGWGEVGKAGKQYDLNNPYQKEEFEKERLSLYEEQKDMVDRANAMYTLSDTDKYVNYYTDERSGEQRRQDPSKGDSGRFEWQDEMYSSSIGAPDSDKRAAHYRSIDSRYNPFGYTDKSD